MTSNDVKTQWRKFKKFLHDTDQKRLNQKNLSRDEITALIKTQQPKHVGRTLGRDLQAALNMISFGSKKVKELEVALSKLLVVGASERVGPILVNELHSSGRKIFLVKGKKDELQGTVRLSDLAELVKGGKVSKVLDHELYYVYEVDSLYVILEQFLQSGKNIFAVKDSDGETTGAIYLEDIVAEITKKT